MEPQQYLKDPSSLTLPFGHVAINVATGYEDEKGFYVYNNSATQTSNVRLVSKTQPQAITVKVPPLTPYPVVCIRLITQGTDAGAELVAWTS